MLFARSTSLVLSLLYVLALPSSSHGQTSTIPPLASWFDQVRDAAALGDAAALAELLKGEIPPAPDGLDPYTYHTIYPSL